MEVLLTQTSQSRTKCQRAGTDASPAPRSAQTPHIPGWMSRRCHLPPAGTVPGQACPSKPVSSMSPELPPLCPGPGPELPRKLRFGAHSLYQQGGATAATPDAGPALFLGREHTPISRGPQETHLALQPNCRKADSYEYVQGPGIFARLPHSLRSIIGGGCATALLRSWACRASSASYQHRCPGSPGIEPDANIATFGWHGWPTSDRGGRVALLRAGEPRSPLGQ